MRRALCWEKKRKKKQTKREEKQRTMWKILTVPVPDRADRAWPYPGRHSVALFFLLRALWVFCYFYACYLFSPLLPRFLINAESANQVFYNLTLGQIRFTGKRWWHSWRSINLNYRQHQITSTGEGSTEKRLVLLHISALDVHRTRLRLIRMSGPALSPETHILRQTIIYTIPGHQARECRLISRSAKVLTSHPPSRGSYCCILESADALDGYLYKVVTNLRIWPCPSRFLDTHKLTSSIY